MSQKLTLIPGGGDLGFALAEEVLKRGEVPLVVSRTAEDVNKYPGSAGILRLNADLASSGGRDLMMDRIEQLGLPIQRVLITMGEALSKSLVDSSEDELLRCILINLTAPLLLIRRFLQFQLEQRVGFHLFLTSSTTFSKVRKTESGYGGAKGGIAQALLNAVYEWITCHLHAKVTHFVPAGMKTRFWEGDPTDISVFLEPVVIAPMILDRCERFEQSPDRFDEWVLDRDGQGNPVPRAGRVFKDHLGQFQFEPGVIPIF